MVGRDDLAGAEQEECEHGPLPGAGERDRRTVVRVDLERAKDRKAAYNLCNSFAGPARRREPL